MYNILLICLLLTFSSEVTIRNNTNSKATELNSKISDSTKNQSIEFSKLNIKNELFKSKNLSDSLKQERAKKQGKWSTRLGLGGILGLILTRILTQFPPFAYITLGLSVISAILAIIFGIISLKNASKVDRKYGIIGIILGVLITAISYGLLLFIELYGII